PSVAPCMMHLLALRAYARARRYWVGALPVACRNAAGNELVSLKPSASAISVTVRAGSLGISSTDRRRCQRSCFALLHEMKRLRSTGTDRKQPARLPSTRHRGASYGLRNGVGGRFKINRLTPGFCALVLEHAGMPQHDFDRAI